MVKVKFNSTERGTISLEFNLYPPKRLFYIIMEQLLSPLTTEYKHKGGKKKELMASKLAPNSFILVSFFLCFLFNVPSTKADQLETLAPDQAKVEAGMTHIHFFFQDIQSGKNPTSITIIQPASSSSSTTLFGLMNMIDDKLTEGPDLSSKEVGRAQGLYASSSLSELGFMQTMNLVFTDGAYNGSVITVLGRNTPTHTTREMSVVGGTGQFRFARGYAIAKTHTLDLTTGDATVEYNVYVTTH